MHVWEEEGERENRRGDTERGGVNCHLCDRSHNIEWCEKFKSLRVHTRKEVVAGSRLCFKCLKKGHNARDC